MSKLKTSVLMIGLVALIAVAFVWANTQAFSISSSDQKAATCEKSAKACAHSSSSATCAGAKSAKNCPMAASCAKAVGADRKACGAKATRKAAVESIRAAEGEVFTLSGRYACAMCDLGVSDRCAPAFTTSDGKNYLLSSNNLSDKLRAIAGEADVEIVGVVRKYDGVKYLEVEAVRASS